jgi:2-polyprenyl-6-methoxyphenol hydroxylase-like FAD-dependent oxidoreductase
MTDPEESVCAIIGAGMGGLAAAAALHQRGVPVQVYEQAEQFLRIGAGIQMSANAMKVLRQLGLEERLRQTAFQHRARRHRNFDTGFIESEFDMSVVEQKFGGPHLMMHRGDLHAALASRVPAERIHLGKKLQRFEQDAAGVTLHFTDGSTVRAGALVAADGVHSVARKQLFGDEAPRFTGRIAYRSTFPAALLGGMDIGDVSTKWWGRDRHIVIYYVTRAKDEVYFTTSVPSEKPDLESWSLQGDMQELREAFRDFHPEVRQVLAACPSSHKWPIHDRDPQPVWGVGRVYLLGDACHPMTPYMAQGAASAIEDAMMLARCFEGVPPAGWPAAFRRYEAARRPRVARIQSLSNKNKRNWMRVDPDKAEGPVKEKAEPDWVYGYDAVTAPLPPLGPDGEVLQQAAA